MTPCEKLGYKVGDKVEYPNSEKWPANCGFPTNKTAVVKAVFKDGNGQDKVALEFTPCNIYVVPAEGCKPIRTERDKAIDDINQVIRDCKIIGNDLAVALYDAGYRKP